MNAIYKYNINAKYSTKDLKGRYTVNNFSDLTATVYDRWPLPYALWVTFYCGLGKYKCELCEYFQMYHCQLNFAMFCCKSALGISLQHLSHPNMLERSVHKFHHQLSIPLPHENSFSKVEISYVESAYYSICDDYGVNVDEIWMNRDWFYMVAYSSFILHKDYHQLALHN